MKKLLIAVFAVCLGLATHAIVDVVPVGAQGPQRICIPVINTTTGFASCQDVSSTNPFPVITGGSSSSTVGIAPVVSSAAETSHVLKAAAGNLYAVYVSNPSASGFLMVFNSTTVPGDGAVTPIHCVPVGAASLGFVNFMPGPPELYATGISVAYSSTGCFTKTTSPTAFFHGVVQ